MRHPRDLFVTWGVQSWGFLESSGFRVGSRGFGFQSLRFSGLGSWVCCPGRVLFITERRGFIAFGCSQELTP